MRQRHRQRDVAVDETATDVAVDVDTTDTDYIQMMQMQIRCRLQMMQIQKQIRYRDKNAYKVHCYYHESSPSLYPVIITLINVFQAHPNSLFYSDFLLEVIYKDTFPGSVLLLILFCQIKQAFSFCVSLHNHNFY